MKSAVKQPVFLHLKSTSQMSLCSFAFTNLLNASLYERKSPQSSHSSSATNEINDQINCVERPQIDLFVNARTEFMRERSQQARICL